LFPTTALEQLLAQSGGWAPDQARSVAEQLRAQEVTADQVASGQINDEDLKEIGIALGNRKRVLAVANTRQPPVAPQPVAASRKRHRSSAHCRSNLVAGIITNAVRKKVDELRVLQFTSLQTCLEDKERADELKSWMEQVAKEQNEANARQLEQKEYPPDTADMLRKPFTAQDVQAKLVNRFSNTGPSKSQLAQGNTQSSAGTDGSRAHTASAASEGNGSAAAAGAGPAGAAAETGGSGRPSRPLRGRQQQQQQSQAQPATPAASMRSCEQGSAAPPLQQVMKRLQDKAQQDPDVAALLRIMQAHQDKAQSRTPDSNPSAAAADGLDAPVPAERTPAAAQPSGPSQQAAGQQAAGQQQRSKGQLCVGDRVEVLAVNKTVAAVGCVTATEPGCLLSQHPDDSTAKVKHQHVAVGNITVTDNMETAAKSVTFWVPQRSIHLTAGSLSCTFWSHRETLKQQGVMVSVPIKRLRRCAAC